MAIHYKGKRFSLDEKDGTIWIKGTVLNAGKIAKKRDGSFYVSYSNRYSSMARDYAMFDFANDLRKELGINSVSVKSGKTQKLNYDDLIGKINKKIKNLKSKGAISSGRVGNSRGIGSSRTSGT